MEAKPHNALPLRRLNSVNVSTQNLPVTLTFDVLICLFLFVVIDVDRSHKISDLDGLDLMD